MNLIAKIFTVLILLLSVCFLSIAVMVAASHKNWKEIALANKEAAERYYRQVEQARAETTRNLQDLRREQVGRAMQIQHLESRLQLAEQNYNDKEAELRAELVISQERLESLRQAEGRLAEQDQQVAELRTQNVQLNDRLGSLSETAIELTKRLYELQMEIELLEDMRGQLAERVAVLTRAVRRYDLDPYQITDMPPRLDGRVTAVENNLIAVSLGRHDGLRPGHRLEIYNGGRYVGAAIVSDADDKNAVARLLREYTQIRVREGDHVTTRF